ncbi:MAG: hypothetical protein AAF974_12865 [Cyanobacteria bacterium P01_E01_bin.34]
MSKRHVATNTCEKSDLLSTIDRARIGCTFRSEHGVVSAKLCALVILGLASSVELTALLPMNGALAVPVPLSSDAPDVDSATVTVQSSSVEPSPISRNSGTRNSDTRNSESSTAELDPEAGVTTNSEVDPVPDSSADADTDAPPERQSSVGAALQTIREQLQRQERPLGSRGSQCPYSPGLVGANDTIWSDRPVFLWRSTGQTLSVYDYETDELLWQQQVEAGTEAVTYGGAPLQAGGLYRWVLMHPQTSDFTATFLVMEATEREALSAELSQAQERWTAANLPATEQALERAMFFSDRRLWSDALQELHAVRDSDEVDDTIHEISIYLCGTLESDIQALEPNL